MRRLLAATAVVLLAPFALADDTSIAKALRSLAEVHQIANVIEVRRATHIKLPLDVPLDPWGTPYRAEVTESGYRIVAAGADRTFDESSWTAAGQFEGVEGDVVFEDRRLVRSNRNWLVEHVAGVGDSAAALEKLHQAEMLFMTMLVPAMQDVMASRVTTTALKELGAEVEAFARANNGSIAAFAFPDVHDGWGTNMQFRVEGETYRIISAGSDAHFDPMSWSRAPAASTAEDLIFENGKLARAHDEMAILRNAILTVPPIPQPVDGKLHDTRFARIAEGVTPPKVLTRDEPKYPESYRRARISGIVIVEASITETGAIEHVKLLKSLAPELDESALKAVRQWTFAPAMREGKPIAVLFSLTINFKLN